MKTLFAKNRFFRAQKIFSRIHCELLLHVNFTQLIGSLCWTQNVSFYKEFLTGKSFKHCMFKLTLQIGIYDQYLLKKKDFDIQSNLIYSNKFLKL